MQYRIDRWIKILTELRERGAKFLTLNSLVYATKMKKESLRVALWRLRKKELIFKVGRWYIIPPASIEEIALIVYPPCYISLEWALFKQNIIDQAPYQCTCITTKKPKIIKTPNGTIEYKHIKRELFFGYNNKLIAYPEKALLDLIYYKRHRDKTINLEDLDKKKLKEYAKKYPKSVQKELRKILNKE